MITLIIPTLNRSEFVIRYLYYLKENNFKGAVFIGDSSDSQHFDETRKVVKELENSFEIIHNYYPGFTINDCVSTLLPLVKTPYAMYICDDDIVVLPTVKKCMDFLDKNPEYSAASGTVVHCHLEHCGQKQKVYSITEGRLNELKTDSGSKRLVELLSSYSVVAFSVARTEQLRPRHPLDTAFRDISLSAELLPCSMLAVQGKLKKFDDIFVVRQIHQRRYIMSDIYDWIVKPSWQPSYQIFQRHLVNCLVAQDKINAEQAAQVVKQAFWAYLSRGLGTNFRKRYQESLLSGAKRKVKAVPYLGRACKKLNSIFQRHNSRFSLASLTSPNSPYYKDFMPVYRIIMRQLKEGKA